MRVNLYITEGSSMFGKTVSNITKVRFYLSISYVTVALDVRPLLTKMAISSGFSAPSLLVF